MKPTKQTPHELAEVIYRRRHSQSDTLIELLDNFEMTEDEAMKIIHQIIIEVGAYNSEAIGFAKVGFIFGKSYFVIVEELYENYPKLIDTEIESVTNEARELAQGKKQAEGEAESDLQRGN